MNQTTIDLLNAIDRFRQYAQEAEHFSVELIEAANALDDFYNDNKAAGDAQTFQLIEQALNLIEAHNFDAALQKLAACIVLGRLHGLDCFIISDMSNAIRHVMYVSIKSLPSAIAEFESAVQTYTENTSYNAAIAEKFEQLFDAMDNGGNVPGALDKIKVTIKKEAA